MAVLREIFVSLGLDVDEASFAKGQLAAGLVEAGLKKLVETAMETVHAFVENTKEAIEYGNRIKKTSQSIGIATDALQELQYAGQLADLSSQEMSQSIGILSRKMQEARKGGEDAGKAFKGIKFQEGGKLLETEEVLGNIADRFQKMPDGAEKTALAMQLFGRAGKQMIPLLNKGSQELTTIRKEARELGLVMGEDALDASEELNDSFERLKAISQGLWRSAIAPLLPAIKELVDRFLAWRKENAKIIAQRLQSFLGILIKTIGILGEVFVSLTRNLIRLKNFVADHLIVVMSALGAIAVVAGRRVLLAWIAAAAPFAAIMAVLTALYLIFDDIAGYYEGKDSLFGHFKKALDDWLKPNAEDPWWLVAVKDLVKLLRDAIELKHELDAALGRVSKEEIDRRAGKNKKAIGQESDVQTLATARRRVGMGLNLTEEEKFALQRQGVPAQSFVSKYAPPTPAAPVSYTPSTPYSGGSKTVTQSIVINANGMTPEQAEPMIRRVLQSENERVNEESAASFPAVP